MLEKNKANRHKLGFTPLGIKTYRHKRRLPKGNLSLTGFMLLEVILSVFVVTVGVVFVINSFITSIKAFKVSRIYVEALYLIEQKLWEYEEKGKIEEGHASGKFDDYKDAEWDIEAKEVEEDLPLYETAATVGIKEEDTKRRFKVTTYFYKEE